MEPRNLLPLVLPAHPASHPIEPVIALRDE